MKRRMETMCMNEQCSFPAFCFYIYGHEFSRWKKKKRKNEMTKSHETRRGTRQCLGPRAA